MDDGHQFLIVGPDATSPLTSPGDRWIPKGRETALEQAILRKFYLQDTIRVGPGATRAGRMSYGFLNAILAPSGDQAGSSSKSPGVWESCTRSVPSGSIAYMSKPPSPKLVNAIRRPSGDQAGSESKAPTGEIRCWSVPSALIT